MTIYAVNGKEPVAAWIPSLDTAGNGTTTLTDLVGSNNGTLTNMDAATIGLLIPMRVVFGRWILTV